MIIQDVKNYFKYSVMAEQPLVTIAMPVYNAERYIKKAIDSILQQTYTNWELVMVNDGSIDHTEEKILSYSDPRIRYFKNDVNSGIVKTRNRCLELARGKYIAVLDNDDIALPKRLKMQVGFLEANNDYGVCGSYWEIIDNNDKLLAKVEIPSTDSEIKTYQLFNNCFCASTVMMRAELVKEAKYQDGSDMLEDFNLYHRLYHLTKFASLPHFLTQYRTHGKNESFKKYDALMALRKKMDATILSRLNIPFTEEELTMHTHFVNGRFSYFKKKGTLQLLELWLLKIKQLLEQRPGIEGDIIIRIFIKRWLQLFHANRWFSVRIINNSLFRNYKMKFIKYLMEFVKEKISKKIQLT